MYHAIEASNRLKHVPLNSYISLSEEQGEGSGLTLADTLVGEQEQNPERIMIQQESYQDFFDHLKEILSPFEQQVCDLYLQGMDYRQIAERMGKSPKSIDNALQRIRGKI
jgi:RNA polymerase sporulation-specific sigma factor